MFASRGTQSHLHSSKPVASFRMRISIGFSALAREIPWRRADASASATDPEVALVADPLIHIPVESLTTTPSPAIEGGLQAASQFILTTSRGGVTQCVWVRTSRLVAANGIGTPISRLGIIIAAWKSEARDTAEEMVKCGDKGLD